MTLCSHDISYFNFTIQDDCDKTIATINGDIQDDTYLSNVLAELLVFEYKYFLEQYHIENPEDVCYRSYLASPFNENAISLYTEANLRQALQLAKQKKRLPLYISSYNPEILSTETKIGAIYSKCTLCKNKKKCKSNSPKFSDEANLKSISSKRNSEDDKLDNTSRTSIKILTNRSDKMPENLATCRQEKVKKLHNDVQKEQKQSNDMDVRRSSNQLHDSDTVPVSWLKEYMEAMKDDMVYKITHEVTKKVTKKVLKYLDLHLQSMLHEQKWSQNISSSERDSRDSSEPIEKNQEQKVSQEQSSNASIECMEEPQNADATKDVQVTKDERSTVDSKKIVKDISELLHKTFVNPIAFAPSKKHKKSSDLIKKNGKEMTPQIEEQLSDKVSAESQDATIAKDLQLLSEVKFIMEKICEFVKEKEPKKCYQLFAQIVDDLEKVTQSQEESDKTSFTASPQLRSMRSADWKPAQIGHHMSCSVTGHQMLDETLQSKDMWSDRRNDGNDKSSFRSCDREDDDDTFEIIQMPTSETENMAFEEPVVEQQEHDSNDRDSPSFELLTEPSSPCSIYITEDHFAAIEGKPNEKDPQANSNNPTNCDGLQLEFEKFFKSTNVSSEKQSGGAYSFVVDTLLAQDFNSVCKARKENICANQRLNESKHSRDSKSGDENSFTENPKVRLIRPTDWLPERSVSEDICGVYDDVRNSHTSYLTVQTQCDCQSQCANSGDLTQSFHSHTTSINDITDVSHRLVYTDNSHSSQMPSTDGQDDAAAIPKSSLDPHVGSDRVKNVKTNERHDADNYPKCREFRAQDADAQHQFHRMNSGFVDRSSPSDVSGKAFAAEQSLSPADSVHILPETLVTAAAQVGSFAYDTAREVFDKIRAHAKEDSTKRRSGTKSDHKKPFGNLPFI